MTNTQIGPDWLTARIAAWRMGVHQKTMVRWCKTSRIIAKKTPGGEWRVHPSIVKAEERAVKCGECGQWVEIGL